MANRSEVREPKMNLPDDLSDQLGGKGVGQSERTLRAWRVLSKLKVPVTPHHVLGDHSSRCSSPGRAALGLSRQRNRARMGTPSFFAIFRECCQAVIDGTFWKETSIPGIGVNPRFV